ncbi:MAG: Na+/H+ antiporter NhaC family protein [Clostridia bacterium]|nr:Na+/H+ antiporter NhaC family protein [Clostridia bacterium]
MLNEKKFFNKKSIALMVASAVIVALLILATTTSEVTGTAWALLPPLIAISLALITKEVFSSLFFGILSGAILAAKWRPAQTIDTIIGTGLTTAVSDSAGIFIFLIELGILVALINKAGGSRAFGEWAKNHVKSKAGAAICTFVLGVFIFIDDYFNCLTVGTVMRPVTDKHKISRSKLAYLIDATAAPICMIAPISSWAAAVNDYAATTEHFKSGLQLFVAAIPFNFYSLLTLIFIIALVVMKIDFGPMRRHEINAMNGDLFSGKKVSSSAADEESSKGRVIDLILPILVLISLCVISLIYVGGFFGEDPEFTGKFIASFGNTDAYVGLPWGGLVALLFTVVYFALRKVVAFGDAMKALPKGFIAMVPAIFILTFATALKNITNGDLNAAGFVETMMANFPEALAKLLPAVIFLVACVIAFATGTSWGTFGILIPIVQHMFPANPEMMVVGISACLAGAVCGDHCSPISDTTIMSSAGAECEHINHVSTQLPYALFVAVVSFFCYIIAGFIPVWYVALPIAIAIMIGSLIVTKIVCKKIYKEEVSSETTAE